MSEHELATTDEGEPKKAPAIVRVLQEASTLESVSAALPASISPERFVRQAQTLVRTTPKLLECPPAPLLGAMIEAAQLGLELSTFLGEAYIVPHWSKRDRALMPTLIPGYKGLVKLVREGEIVEFYAHLVRKHDPFKLELGSVNRLMHEPDVFATAEERGPVIGGYAIAKNTRGGLEIEPMSLEQLEAIQAEARNKTKEEWQWKKSPWYLHTEEMMRKTLLRRLAKRLPKSDRAARALQLSAMAEGGEPEIIHLGDARIEEPPDYTPAVAMTPLGAAEEEGSGEPVPAAADGAGHDPAPERTEDASATPSDEWDAEESRQLDLLDGGGGAS